MKATRIGQNYLLKVKSINYLSPFFKKDNVELINFFEEKNELKTIFSDSLTFEELAGIIIGFYGDKTKNYYPIFESEKFNSLFDQPKNLEEKITTNKIIKNEYLVYKYINFLNDENYENYLTIILSDYSIISFKFTISKAPKYKDSNLSKRYIKYKEKNVNYLKQHNFEIDTDKIIDNYFVTKDYGKEIADTLLATDFVSFSLNQLNPTFEWSNEESLNYYDYELLLRLDLSTISKDLFSIYEWRDDIYQNYLDDVASEFVAQDDFPFSSIKKLFNDQDLNEEDREELASIEQMMSDPTRIKELQGIINDPNKLQQAQEEIINKMSGSKSSSSQERAKSNHEQARKIVLETFVNSLLNTDVPENEIVKMLDDFLDQVQDGTFLSGMAGFNLSLQDREKFIQDLLDIYYEKKYGEPSKQNFKKEKIDNEDFN
ncbi:hypothetical protein DIE66_02630 [Mycoplasmopsis arginini]|uniref:hypothetical protein n=1 Tax=Mycoplasmopsis arginini TaxID=2094 RepID=UPI000D61A74D|nr:hypothetical protein [Mycoplasmopsis arginini]PWC08679.1 hypothetical protein DIE66_02630 [Mycoplasmopsis arginini]